MAYHGAQGRHAARRFKETRRLQAEERGTAPYEATAAYRRNRDAWQVCHSECRVPGFCHTVGECGCIPVRGLGEKVRINSLTLGIVA
jgi:hypothetical protein